MFSEFEWEIVLGGRRQITQELAELLVVDDVTNIGFGNDVAACRCPGFRHLYRLCAESPDEKQSGTIGER